MIASLAMLRESGRNALQAWRTFWFSTEPGYTLGLIRIAFGALTFLWSLEIGVQLYDKFSVNGIVPQPPTYPYLWGVFYAYPGDTALLVGWIVLMVSSVVLIAGWHSKLAAFVVFVMIMSFERRNPWIFNSGDALIRIMSLYLALSPCGAALSLDQRRRVGSFWSAQDVKVWPMRLMQVQISIIYLSTVVSKLHGDKWQDGSAVSYTLRLTDLLLLPTPDWMTTSPLIMNVMTWGTLVVEFAIGVFVWNKRWRTKVLIAGVFLHLTILLTMAVGFFSLAMFVLYLSFVPWERSKSIAMEAQRRISALARRFRRRPDVDDAVTAPPDAVTSAMPVDESPESPGRHSRDGGEVPQDGLDAQAAGNDQQRTAAAPVALS